MTDWYEDHIVIQKETWRQRLSARLYDLADFVSGERAHYVVIRDQSGAEFFHATGQYMSFSMPPPPYSVWCCDGRIDDGAGGVRTRPTEEKR